MTRPNVLILLTDQQRFDTIAAAGYAHMITPNLDRLARLGTMFTCAHSSNPVCMAARHDLLTGLPGRAHGYYGNNERPIKDYALPTLPGILRDAGYRTAAIGKCHHYPARAHHGFGELHLMEELPVCRADDEYATFLAAEGLGHLQNIHGVRPHVYHIPQKSQMDLAHHGSTWVTDRTIRWLDDNGDAPFFLFCGWIHPHPPWDIPEEFRGLYRRRELPEPVPVSRTWPEPTGPNPWFGDLDTPEQKRRIREAYYASITCVDQAIGRLLDYLERCRLLDDTLILFTSDHGEMLQDKGYYSKESPYESSVRVPLIVKPPRGFAPARPLPVGGTCPDFTDTLDILPTCLDVCGLTYPAGAYQLPGRSICRPEVAARSVQVSTWGPAPEHRWLMARSRQFKYIYKYNGGHEELYDLARDPGELTNLLATGHAVDAGILTPLRQAVLDWERQWGPEWALDGDRLRRGPRAERRPFQCCKFHKWANTQFQFFDKRPNAVRGEQFLREIQHALSDTGYSGVTLPEVFHDPEWVAQFAECWNKYGAGDQLLHLLFPKS